MLLKSVNCICHMQPNYSKCQHHFLMTWVRQQQKQVGGVHDTREQRCLLKAGFCHTSRESITTGTTNSPSTSLFTRQVWATGSWSRECKNFCDPWSHWKVTTPQPNGGQGIRVKIDEILVTRRKTTTGIWSQSSGYLEDGTIPSWKVSTPWFQLEHLPSHLQAYPPRKHH